MILQVGLGVETVEQVAIEVVEAVGAEVDLDGLPVDEGAANRNDPY